jgi:hypothetical protein
LKNHGKLAHERNLAPKIIPGGNLKNEWDTRGTESNEGLHSLGWESREEESWRKFEIVVGECKWVVGFSEL